MYDWGRIIWVADRVEVLCVRLGSDFLAELAAPRDGRARNADSPGGDVKWRLIIIVGRRWNALHPTEKVTLRCLRASQTHRQASRRERR